MFVSDSCLLGESSGGLVGLTSEVCFVIFRGPTRGWLWWREFRDLRPPIGVEAPSGELGPEAMLSDVGVRD